MTDLANAYISKLLVQYKCHLTAHMHNIPDNKQYDIHLKEFNPYSIKELNQCIG